MPFIEWKPVYSVGIDLMDMQHQKLIGYMNAFHESGEAGNAPAAKVALRNLVDYARKHFSEEEALMLSGDGFPDFEAHKKLHTELLGNVQRLADKYLAAPNAENSGHLSRFLKNWLMSHILGVDKKYGAFFA